VLETRYAVSFNRLPYFIYNGTGDHLLHFAEQLVRIIDTGYPSEAGYRIAGEDSIQVDGADGVHLLPKEEEEEAEVVLEIEELSFGKKQPKAALTKGAANQGKGGLLPAADQGDLVSGGGKRCADPYHTLVIIEVIGHRTKDPFWHRAKI